MALSSAHASIRRLCEALEDVADSLPANVNRSDCRRLADDLVPALKAAQEAEEMQVFPAIRRAASGRNAAEALDRLAYEHFEDLCFAEEVTDVLRRLSIGDTVNTEAVGYMLRGLFGALRRHLSFEQELAASRLR
ncbi:hemerythrin domain-containing protein [Martelella lutilitoris]|uniref:Hemerythrin domain-containing protein n=1 Tax=Martelella lutilitoris TaxID=2583532 RepID=A0A5C4JMJ7_9HYPH|nr:hemerythrin domain-containing protein [Martelella lutilitoris]TNB46550.1 hemerythrin domain-containing protein [Martelella lutilitoris]